MRKLEIPVFTAEAALRAAKAGAHRLELCSDFTEGGTTPSAGLLKFLKSIIEIPIYVMIRPRGGDFIYTEEELQVMELDIANLKALGADGFVFGVLDKHGMVDQQANRRLLTVAGDSPCTFHRAFDLTADLFQSLNDIQELGFARILTSGGQPTVTEGWDTIVQLIEQADQKLIIMPGGGSKPDHAQQLASKGILQEIHASCKDVRSSEAVFKKEGMSFSIDPIRFHQVLTVDPSLVQEFLEILKNE